MRQGKAIFGASVFISLLAHGLFIGFLHTHSLWFCSSVDSIRPKSSRSIGKLSHDQILKEAFAQGTSNNGSSVDLKAENRPLKLSMAFQESSLPHQTPWDPGSTALSLSLDELLFSEQSLVGARPKMPELLLMPQFLEGLILPSLEKTQIKSQPIVSSPQSQVLPFSHLKTVPKEILQDPSMDPLTFLSTHTPKAEKDPLPSFKTASVPLPQLPEFLSLAELSTVNLSEAFSAELTFLPKADESGYLFALTLVAREDLHLPKIAQRITFLIDRSNSIQRERFLASKQAVLRALEELEEKDSFNILVFDSKTEKLFSTFMPANPTSLAKAEDFLEKMNLGSFFAITDLYKPLLHTIPSHVKDNEIHTAILLTDGETLASKTVRASLLHDWTLQNQGKVSLFIVGLDTDSQAESLDTLCSLNRGKWIQSSSQRGLKRQTLKLAKNIKTPVAKDLSSKIICKTSNPHIHIYPQATFSPHLYLDQPYVLVGSTETLDDFLVFIQGRLNDQWLNIKKTVSFVNAKKGTLSLKTAFLQYEKLDPQHIQ